MTRHGRRPTAAPAFTTPAFLTPALMTLACAAAASAGLMQPARAQDASGPGSPLNAVLPAAGYSAAPGTLRSTLDRQAAGGGLNLEPGWRVTPSISVDVGATDNAAGIYAGASASGADALAIVTPGVTVSGQTSRVQLNAGYTPSVTRYLRNGSSSTVYQDLYASARVTLVPDALYISAVGSVFQQSQAAGAFTSRASVGADPTEVNRNDLSTTSTVAITPYAVHRFGAAGSGQVGYTFAATASSGGDTSQLDDAFGGRYADTRPLLTNREFASFTTGDGLGRLLLTTSAEATQFSGSGVYSNSRRNIVAQDATYALNRFVALIGRVGFEDIRYGGTAPTLIDGALWRAGVRLTPGPNSQITVAYNHSDGITSPYLAATWTPTARTRVDASYSAGLTTDLEDIQNTAVVSTYDTAGGAYNRLTGGPVGAPGGGYFGIDNNLFRLRRLAASLALLYDRDTYTVTVANERRTVVSAARTAGAALVGTSDEGSTATLQWDHAISPVLTSSASASIGTSRITGAGGGRQTTYGAFAGLFRQLSPTVTVSARYIFQARTGDDRLGLASSGYGSGSNSLATRTGVVNTILLGIRKTF